MQDIRLRTCLIIKREDEYLVSSTSIVKIPTWSRSPWDAWRTRSVERAKRVAERMGGTLYLFNPMVGQLRKAAV